MNQGRKPNGRRYTKEQKLAIVKYFEQHGYKETAAYFGIGIMTVYRCFYWASKRSAKVRAFHDSKYAMTMISNTEHSTITCARQ